MGGQAAAVVVDTHNCLCLVPAAECCSMQCSAVTPAGHKSWLAGRRAARLLQWSCQTMNACVWRLLQHAMHTSTAGATQPSNQTLYLQLLYPTAAASCNGA